jgi:5-methyltetrahydropteroyltriglutamate--homocysteine methyltransferase
MRNHPLYPVTVVGSWPRPAWLLDAARARSAALPDLRDRAVLAALEAQERAGTDIVSDGEQRRDNFYSFLCERLEGLELMTLAQLLDHVEDKAAFETLLRALDVPAYSIKNPTVVAKLERHRPLVLDDYRFLRERTRKPVKVTLPGPYLLSRSIWVKGLSETAYPTRELLNDDIVRILHDELVELAAAGADVVQFDEPVLSELVFAGKSATRTFMCAALAAKSSPEDELRLAASLINRVIEGVRDTLCAMHVCRGNWSTREEVLLSGSYDALMPTFRAMELGGYVLEYATERAGPLSTLLRLPAGSRLGFGAVNPRTPEIEDPDAVVARVRALTEFVEPERIQLNPDCGFGTFAERPMASADIAERKLAALAEAARRLR